MNFGKITVELGDTDEADTFAAELKEFCEINDVEGEVRLRSCIVTLACRDAEHVLDQLIGELFIDPMLHEYGLEKG